MLGKDIVIDKGKCDGCGLCVGACHEGALALVDGKAELVRRDFCDGLGDCLPACPRGAISFADRTEPADTCTSSMDVGFRWPIQLALVPPRSDFFRGSIVFAADCTAFVSDDFRNRVLRGRPVVIGCPKLDERSRFDKVLAILRDNPVDEVEVVRMVVPCCRALTNIVRTAAAECGRDVAVKETILSRSGTVVPEDSVPDTGSMVVLRRRPPAPFITDAGMAGGTGKRELPDDEGMR